MAYTVLTRACLPLQQGHGEGTQNGTGLDGEREGTGSRSLRGGRSSVLGTVASSHGRRDRGLSRGSRSRGGGLSGGRRGGSSRSRSSRSRGSGLGGRRRSSRSSGRSGGRSSGRRGRSRSSGDSGRSITGARDSNSRRNLGLNSGEPRQVGGVRLQRGEVETLLVQQGGVGVVSVSDDLASQGLQLGRDIGGSGQETEVGSLVSLEVVDQVGNEDQLGGVEGVGVGGTEQNSGDQGDVNELHYEKMVWEAKLDGVWLLFIRWGWSAWSAPAKRPRSAWWPNTRVWRGRFCGRLAGTGTTVLQVAARYTEGVLMRTALTEKGAVMKKYRP